MSKFISLYNNPRHTMLVTPDEEVVYEVKSEHGISTIKRFLPKKLGMEDEQQELADRPFVVVGTLNWGRPMSFTVGTNPPVKASEFLRIPYSDNKFKQFLKIAEENDKREFTGPGGQIYVWKLSGELAELRRKGDPTPLASYTMERGSFLGPDTRATLFVTAPGLEMLDLLVLTWVPVALLLNTFKSKGMFASTETEWGLASAGVDVAKDY